ncbi:MAG TPA: nitrogen fixation protein NifQ [Methylococcus sp.]|nr:nitrogen fixation protein NifQ [Methylococcus sp.]
MCAAAVHYDPLLAYAREPQDPVTRAFAAAIELARSSAHLVGRVGLGLGVEEFALLLDRYFPGAHRVYLPATMRSALAKARRSRSGVDEFEDLLALFLEHRGDDGSETRWLAHAIAVACFGEDHLWQDLGLPDRETLSGLLARHFPSLFARNTRGMRWKKFFYKELCDREGGFVCRSPSCAECSEYLNCFGPEEEGPWQRY